MRLPDFICIGAMRSGTTTLWKMMKEMPDIYLPEKKELHFFDRNYNKGLSYYMSFFNEANPAQICGEFTPAYLPSNECCQLIRKNLQKVKFLVILRDPVLRAWSHYRYSVRWGPESLPIKKALKLEETRIEKGGDHEAVYYSYKKRGQYIDQLQDYEIAFSRDHIQVVFLENLLIDKDHTLNSVRKHIGLTPLSQMPSTTMAHTNKSTQFPISLELHQRTKKLVKLYYKNSFSHKIIRKFSSITNQINLLNTSPKLPESVYDELNKYYEPFNARLADWLGRPVPW